MAAVYYRGVSAFGNSPVRESSPSEHEKPALTILMYLLTCGTGFPVCAGILRSAVKMVKIRGLRFRKL